VGAALGLALAAVVVWNLNEIQELLAQWIGFRMWDPTIYYFDRIPGRLDPKEVTIIMVSAVVASVLGALVPAWLAARTDPVASLRYE
jgi:lipoprotein-releasing system permease protein